MDGHGVWHLLNRERVHFAWGEENPEVVHMTFRCERRPEQRLKPPEHPWDGEYLVTTKQRRKPMRAIDDELYVAQIHTVAEKMKHRCVWAATDGGAQRCATLRGPSTAAAAFATDTGTETIGIRLGGVDDTSFGRGELG